MDRQAITEDRQNMDKITYLNFLESLSRSALEDYIETSGKRR